MSLGDLLTKISNDGFLLTISGVCDEWYGGVKELKDAPYYGAYKDRRIKQIAILLTNGIPELSVRLEER